MIATAADAPGGKAVSDDTQEWTFAMIDLAGFTALTETHGDERAADLATSFAGLAAHHLGPSDRLIKTLGDAVLLAAENPTTGLELVRKILEDCYQTDGYPEAGPASITVPRSFAARTCSVRRST